MKIIFLIFCLISSNVFAAIDNSTNIEHQIRLCDSEQEIINKFLLNSLVPIDLQTSEFQLYYIDTIKRDYDSLKWSLRVRVKNKKTEITVKKKSIREIDLAPKYPNMICEYDLHGSVKEYSCKISTEVLTEDFLQVLKNNKNWLNILDFTQRKFLSDNNALFKNAVIYGSLIDRRFRWEDTKFGLVTLDLIHQYGHEQNTYHEISIRYPFFSSKDVGVQFMNSVQSTGTGICSEQTNYPSKFDVLEVLNLY